VRPVEEPDELEPPLLLLHPAANAIVTPMSAADETRRQRNVASTVMSPPW
jgi:hypothetical protein